MCDPCWKRREPNREAVRVLVEGKGFNERCCFCGSHHASGIYVRQDPTTLPCNGEHEEEATA